ncbi:hypothetical protein [Rouxiella sp. Mn2063]|uniref:hypothetical protein n=1 Tax=Rouxiella sp. Mn2063 TaxID=3395262 RepID=UPI003BC7217B
MEIDIRKAGVIYKLSEVKVSHGEATIKFDIRDGEERSNFLKSLVDAAFGEMSMDEIMSYLDDEGYSDEVIERNSEGESEENTAA